MGADVHSTPNRQTRKRLATRQRISDVATLLFFERGFDKVTIEEIAEAADVSRMTVFNHFTIGCNVIDVTCLTPPVESLKQFAHWAVANQRPYVRFSTSGTDKFMSTIEASEALKARARAIRDELTDTLTVALANATNRALPDPAARLAASLLVATWTVALIESHRAFQQHQNVAKANIVLLGLIDRGTKGVQAALEGTPYR
jgi:AcrR family transcriptional regulator